MAKRTIIIGTSAVAIKVAYELSARHNRYYKLVGVITEEKRIRAENFSCPRLGSIPELRAVVSRFTPKCIVVAMDGKYDHIPIDQLIELRTLRHITIETGNEVLEKLSGKLDIDSLTAGSTLFSREFRPGFRLLFVGRLISIATALTSLIISLPLMFIIALAVRVDSRGPILFTQERIGLGGKKFKLFKFRSMHPATDRKSEWAGDNADKITRVGKWIRKFRLDELPQFINVVRGDMNIVGPRPHPLSNRELFVLVSRNRPTCGQQIPYYSLRQSILPGITGWAQVRYKYANGLDEEIEKLQYDLYYIKHYSPLLDIRILLETLKVVVCGHACECNTAKEVHLQDEEKELPVDSGEILPPPVSIHDITKTHVGDYNEMRCIKSGITDHVRSN